MDPAERTPKNNLRCTMRGIAYHGRNSCRMLEAVGSAQSLEKMSVFMPIQISSIFLVQI